MPEPEPAGPFSLPGVTFTRRTLLSSAALVALAACSRTPPGNPDASSPPPEPASPTQSATAQPVEPPTSPAPTAPTSAPAPPFPTRAAIVAEFADRRPTDFGIFLPGVVKHGRRGVALTFDACGGGAKGDGFDAALIKTLIRYQVPATLFLNGRWIKANPRIAADLAANPLFELANHGWRHRPLTVRGQKAYGIAGTDSVAAAYDEISKGLFALAEITGQRSPFFRPGTAWVDDVGVAIAKRLGVRVVAFDINVDAGATASRSVVAQNLSRVGNKSITLAHFNRPEGHTAEGLAKALPRLVDAGTRFLTLSQALG